jgi:hypothetical protein
LISAKLKDRLTAVTVSPIRALISADPASRLGRQIKGKDRETDVNPIDPRRSQGFAINGSGELPRILPGLQVRPGNEDALRETPGAGAVAGVTT